MTVTQTYHSKVIPIGELHAEKIAEAVLLIVSTTAFPASPFQEKILKVNLRVLLVLEGFEVCGSNQIKRQGRSPQRIYLYCT